MKDNEAIEAINLKFNSGNQIQPSRAMITNEEWEGVRASLNRSPWVSVEDAELEDGDWCIAWRECEDYTGACKFQDGKFWFNGTIYHDGVTHVQPLPLPPIDNKGE